ncbi:hypothetical protein EPR50_G00207000 [Perca flavescens]|uniref:Uncharacterized protein n=1 Tax=Perca flavescens TaxID=8167 RepID=A0A484C504_PERFV|nr:hypothetical protein EPR50_G00207000 [Perca flavescens]
MPRPLSSALHVKWHAEATVEVTFLRGWVFVRLELGWSGLWGPCPPRAVETSVHSDHDPRCFNGIIIGLLAGRRLKINTFGQDSIQKQYSRSILSLHPLHTQTT